MATTLTKILIHFIFSTKNRQPLITPDIEPRLHACMAGIAKNCKSPILEINGTSDHVHLLVSMAKTITVADLMETVKKESSKWIKTLGNFRNFHWQEGYAGLSIGESAVDAVRAYIQNQKKHHRRTTFQEELLIILNKYKVEYDEKYLWT